MLNENKQLNNNTQVSNQNANFGVSGVAIFKDKPELLYVYKKTEKLVSAIYLLSNFISDSEPLKWQIRSSGVEALSCSLSLSVNPRNFILASAKLLSYFEVAYISGLISEMNFNILKNEFEQLIQWVESQSKKSGIGGFAFPEHFLEVKEPIQNLVPVNNNLNNPNGQNIMSDRNTLPATNLSVKRPVGIVRPNESKQKDKDNRQGVIISILKKGGELGIKDFTKAISGCSEKTIQRELATLVSNGQIKKAGEKRWSRYSIKG
jgi:hypothetical protein